MFPSVRDLGGLSRAAGCFISVVSVANCGASPVANLRAANLCMTNRRVAFVNDYRAVVDFTLLVTVAVAVLAFIIAAVVIAAIGIGSPVVVTGIVTIAVDSGSIATVARGLIGCAPAEQNSGKSAENIFVHSS